MWQTTMINLMCWFTASFSYYGLALNTATRGSATVADPLVAATLLGGWVLMCGCHPTRC